MHSGLQSQQGGTAALQRNHEAIEALFAADGPLARIKDGYGPRAPQITLAREAARAMVSGDILLADAPTGTGKGLAYLAAGILGGRKLVVSTATLALQRQLVEADLPLLKRAVAELYGYPPEEAFSFDVLKGRSNYLCHNRYYQTAAEPGLLGEESGERIRRFVESTSTGDREDLPEPVAAGRWLEVASDGQDCSPSSCEYRGQCFYYAARERATAADVLVANHALVMANSASGGNVFETDGRHLVADEAHRVEEVAAEAFGMKVSHWRVRYVLRQALKKNPGLRAYTDRAEKAADRFFSEIVVGGELGDESAAPGSYGALRGRLVSVEQLLKNDTRQEAVNVSVMVTRLRRELELFYSQPRESHAYAITAGRGVQSSPELRSWLIETGQAFREEVLRGFVGRGKVLVSATLASSRRSGGGGSFSYARDRLGLDTDVAEDTSGAGGNGGVKAGRSPAGEVRELASPEVFDYAGRVLIYTGAEETVGASDSANARRAAELVRIAGGDVLVLLTTWRAVEAFKEHFDPGEEYPVRYQGDDAPGRLTGWMRGTSGGVLVGTRSFNEGVDIPGDALRMVIVDKVPFPAPDDPVIEALCARAGNKWFKRVSLPRAQVTLRQGAGRLMRGASDRGVIAVLDGRISASRWGPAVMGALPDAPVTDEVETVRRLSGTYLVRDGRSEAGN